MSSNVISKIISSRYTNADETEIEFVLELDDGSIIPYGYVKNSHDSAPIVSQIDTLFKAGKVSPDSYNGPTKSEIAASECRNNRDKLLKKTDVFVSAPDYPITDIQRDEIKEYRKQLRDITKQSGFPDNIRWPKIPNCIKDKVS